MDDSALNHTLEASCWLHLAIGIICYDIIKLILDMHDEHGL